MNTRLAHLSADVLGLSPEAKAMLAARPFPLRDGGASGWVLPARVDQVPRAVDRLHVEDRQLLAETLENELGARGAHVRTLDAARSLAAPGTFVVTTCVDPRPFGGVPADLVAALQTARLAHELAVNWKTAVVPLVWLRGDDHELGRANHGRFLNPALDLMRVGLSSLASKNERPLSTLVLRDEVHRLSGTREALRQTLWQGPHRDAALELCVPRDGESLVDSAWRALAELTGPLGVLVVHPDWLRVETSRALSELVPRLPPFDPARGGGDRPLVWHLEVGCRRPLLPGGEGFRYPEEPGSRTAEELAAEIVQDPADWSPSEDLLAPVLAAVLPVAAEVIDWSEVPARRAGLTGLPAVPPPAPWVPRIGLTLVDGDTEASLARLELDLTTALGLRGALPNPAARDAAAARALEELRGACKRASDELRSARPSLAEVDRGLSLQLKREIADLGKRVERLAKKAERVVANRSGKSRRHVRRVAHVLMPEGLPQELHLNLLGFLARHGTDWVDELASVLDPFAPEHMALFLDPAPAGDCPPPGAD